MKKLISVLAALAMMATAAVSVSAVSETMNVAQGTPVIDGQIDDVWANAQKVELTHVKAGDLRANGMPEGLSVSARAL